MTPSVESEPRNLYLQLLAVDDDEVNLLLLQHIFCDMGDVMTASSGYDAIELLKTQTFDLILLDYCMEDMDGFTVLDRIRADERTAHIPVVIVTGDIEASLEAEGFARGATDFIRKPFMPQVVQQRVRRICEYEYLQKNLRNEVRRQTALAETRLASSMLQFRQMCQALAKTIDAKDRYTSGHSERVAEYACTIASHCGKSQEDLQKIYYMGLLHDIGKIGISERILNKPGRLDDEEYRLIQSHTVIGAEILQKIAGFPELSWAALSHHERFDGHGYPNGLTGSAVNDFVRIISVADAYDAMTSTRSYRNHLPMDVVEQEIVRGIGNQFDPVYAETLLHLMDTATYPALKESAGHFSFS